jgi:hypothetical protein
LENLYLIAYGDALDRLNGKCESATNADDDSKYFNGLQATVDLKSIVQGLPVNSLIYKTFKA